MSKRRFETNLSVKGVNNLIKELKAYKKDLNQKVKEFIRELAESGIPVIDTNMQKASFKVGADGVQSGADPEHKTKVKVTAKGNKVVADLIVSGEDLLFIEFGAGVYYNTPPGTSPHPKGEEFGFVIGSYGKHHGVQKVWGYYDDDDKLVLTHGVEATMPVYKASMEMIQNVYKIAKKVFG